MPAGVPLLGSAAYQRQLTATRAAAGPVSALLAAGGAQPEDLPTPSGLPVGVEVPTKVAAAEGGRVTPCPMCGRERDAGGVWSLVACGRVVGGVIGLALAAWGGAW